MAPPLAITRAHAIRDVLVQVVGRIWNLLLGVVVVVAITRTLGVDLTGEWSTLLAISTITAYLIDPGLQTATIRLSSADPGHEANWLGALVTLRSLTGVCAALVCFGVTLTVARGSAMVIAGALISANALSSPAQALGVVFQLRVRNDRTIAFVTLNSILWTTAACVVALVGGGLVAFAATLLLTGVSVTLMQALYVWRRTPVTLARFGYHARELLRLGLVVGLGSALTIVYGKVDQVLVLRYEGTRGAGLYAVAYSLLDRVQFLPVALMTTVLPIVSAAWPADPPRARRTVQRALGYMALVSFPALAFTIGAGRPLVVLLFGNQFAPASGAVPILLAAFIPICLGYVTGSLAVVVGRQGTFVLIALGGLVFNVIGNIVLIPHFGYIAAAWMTLATEMLVICPAAVTILGAMHLVPDLGRFPRAAAAAAIMGALVWLAHRAGFGIVWLGLLAAVVYPLAVLATGALTPDELAELTSRLRRRKPSVNPAPSGKDPTES
ncbi:MAG: flippase [Solirubrobacteraceae bacterium]